MESRKSLSQQEEVEAVLKRPLPQEQKAARLRCAASPLTHLKFDSQK